MKKKIKDLTLEECKAICKKARTNKKGKLKDNCTTDCPLNTNDYTSFFQYKLRICEILKIFNQEIEVEENDN